MEEIRPMPIQIGVLKSAEICSSLQVGDTIQYDCGRQNIKNPCSGGSPKLIKQTAKVKSGMSCQQTFYENCPPEQQPKEGDRNIKLITERAYCLPEGKTCNFLNQLKGDHNELSKYYKGPIAHKNDKGERQPGSKCNTWWFTDGTIKNCKNIKGQATCDGGGVNGNLGEMPGDKISFKCYAKPS